MTAYGHNNDLEHREHCSPHGLGLGAALLLASTLAACFTGTGAEGLNCENDDDCGPDLTCDTQTWCCGGACLSPGTTTTNSTSTTETTTTERTTTESETEPSTTTLTPTTDGSTGNPIPVCGDAQTDVENDEECDDGEGNNQASFSPCTDDCLEADFLYAPIIMQPDIPSPPWNPAQNTIDTTLMTDGWRVLGMGEWGSGEQPPQMPLDVHGIKTLVSSRFRIDAPSATLILDHVLNFDVCAADEIYDGGRVFGVRVGDGMRFQIAPEPNSPTEPAWIAEINENPGGCGTAQADNPWAADGFNAFVGNAMRMNDEFPIPPDLLGQEIYLEFAAAYDCTYCGVPPLPRDTWVVRQVMVKPVPEP